MTDLGVINYSASLLRSGYAKIPDGDMYSYWWYYYSHQVTVNTNIISLNHENGQAIVSRGPLGRPYFNYQHPVNNLIYLGTYCNADVPGKLSSFNFLTGEVVALADVPDWPGSPTKDGINVGIISGEANRRIFGVTGTKAGMFAHDPVTGLTEDFGILDDPENSPYYRYGQSIQVDANFAYVAIKDVTKNQHYLVSVRLSDHLTTAFWKAEGSKSIYIRNDGNYNLFIYRTLNDDSVVYYTVNGTDEPQVHEGDPGCYQHYAVGPGVDYTGYAMNGDLAYPPGTPTEKNITMRYKRPGDSVWRTSETELIDLDEYGARVGGLDLDNKIIFPGEAYGPMVKFNPVTHEKSLMGASPASIYSFYRDRFSGLQYLAGYPNGATYVYDRAQAWELGKNPKAISVANPDNLPNARYGDFCHLATDGKIWFVFDWVRITGGTLIQSTIAWYDPVTKETEAVDYEALLPYNVDGAAINRAGTKLVFSGFKTDMENAYVDSYLFVIPIFKKAISKRLVPLPSLERQGRLISVESGRSTTNRFVGITVGANYWAYCINIGTGKLIWGPLQPGGGSSSFAILNTPARGPLFAHGYLWYYAGNNIMKMDPADGSTEVAQAVTEAGCLLWVDETLYHWENTSKKLHEYKGLV
jgi:hypothetical protein